MYNLDKLMDEVESDDLIKLLEIVTELDLTLLKRDDGMYVTHFQKIETLTIFITFLKKQNYTFYISVFEADWFIKLEGTK